MPNLVQRLESIQYTGTNGPDIITWLNGTAQLATDDGTTLVLDYCGSQYPVPQGGYVIGSGSNHSFYCAQSAADYTASWVELPSS
jgi:hypothetical protein